MNVNQVWIQLNLNKDSLTNFVQFILTSVTRRLINETTLVYCNYGGLIKVKLVVINDSH